MLSMSCVDDEANETETGIELVLMLQEVPAPIIIGLTICSAPSPPRAITYPNGQHKMAHSIFTKTNCVLHHIYNNHDNFSLIRIELLEKELI